MAFALYLIQLNAIKHEACRKFSISLIAIDVFMQLFASKINNNKLLSSHKDKKMLKLFPGIWSHSNYRIDLRVFIETFTKWWWGWMGG